MILTTPSINFKRESGEFSNVMKNEDDDEQASPVDPAALEALLQEKAMTMIEGIQREQTSSRLLYF